MMTFLITLHVIFCLLLIVVILIQAGRGGGLVEMLSGVESMFGTKTSALLTKATTILSVAFFITCLSLALLSARQSRSLIRDSSTEAASPEAIGEEAVLPDEEKVEAVLPGEEKVEVSEPESSSLEELISKEETQATEE